MTTTVRFWVWINDAPVKLTLREGGHLYHYKAASTDEGWRTEANVWIWAKGEDTILHSTYSREVDCDGRMDHEHASRCPLDQLAAWDDGEDGVAYPLWLELSSSQRDHSAEAMGY